MAKISVLGSGGWGTALAMVSLSCGHETLLWSPFEKEIRAIALTHENKLLDRVKIPSEIILTSNLEDITGSELILLAVPSFALRETAAKIKEIVSKDTIVVNVSKGLEKDTLLRLSEVLAEELPKTDIVVLSGPSHAEEVARKIPTSVVAAGEEKAAERVQKLLSCEYLRIYTNDDVVGVEIGAALKNVIAVAAGILDGLKLGDNTKAALITRGIAEMARLGRKMKAREETFAGLAGIGDLVVTCTSMHSRNRRFGILVGKGMKPDKALAQIGTVEGYFATAAAKQMADSNKVEMPIVSECYKVLYEDKNPRTAIHDLMNREMKRELAKPFK